MSIDYRYWHYSQKWVDYWRYSQTWVSLALLVEQVTESNPDTTWGYVFIHVSRLLALLTKWVSLALLVEQVTESNPDTTWGYVFIHVQSHSTFVLIVLIVLHRWHEQALNHWIMIGVIQRTINSCDRENSRLDQIHSTTCCLCNMQVLRDILIYIGRLHIQGYVSSQTRLHIYSGISQICVVRLDNA